jgi:hypothetical protein|tara:strand:- start:5744 stop:5920 length:177 start_codon:yes stop_codon:yes gene_type:complete
MKDKPLEIRVGEQTIPVINFQGFGSDPTYLARVDNDLYKKTIDGSYILLTRDYYREDL